MRRVENRGHGAELIYDGAPVGRVPRELGRETGAGEILFRRERALAQIERNILMEAAKVVVELGPASPKRVDGDAKARRPVAREDIADPAAAGARAAYQALLFPAITQESGDEAVQMPCILSVGCVVVRFRVERGHPEFTAVLPQINSRLASVRKGDQRTQRTGLVLPCCWVRGDLHGERPQRERGIRQLPRRGGTDLERAVGICRGDRELGAAAFA